MVSKEILHVVRPRLRCALPAAGPATHALCACLIPPGRLLLPVVATADARWDPGVPEVVEVALDSQICA